MFDGMTTIEIIKMLSPLIALQVGLALFCLWKLRNDKVKFLPKPIWVIIVVVVNIFGPIAYLSFGRERY